MSRKEIPIPKEKFEAFYGKFKTVGAIMQSEEWKNIFSNYYNFCKLEQEIEIGEAEIKIEAYDPQRQAQEIIKCANSFEYFCHKYVKIVHPIHGLIPLILYGYQRRVIREYEKNRFNITSKFRQGGLTTISVLWALWRCLFHLDQQILIMSRTDREAIAAGDIARRALEHMPAWLKPDTGKNNEHEMQFRDTGSTLWCYTPEAARGKSITLLIIDEAAFIPDMAKHWKSMYPTIATGGACAVVSTVNGLGNWYEEMYHEAEAGKNVFKVIDLDYWEHPDYNDPNWVRDFKRNQGEKGWQQEILRSFLGSGETFIPPDVINELDNFARNNSPARVLFSKWNNKEKERTVEWDDGALWIWKEPVEGHEYVIGADCAEGVGESGDNSCFQILDQSTLEQVAEFYSNSVPPHIFAQILNEIGYYYNSALLVIEHMNPGPAVLSALQNDLAYEHLYYEMKGKQQYAGIKTNKNNRPIWFETLQNRLLNGAVKINSKRFVNELKTFIYNVTSKKAEAQRGKHDDAILALALALYVRDSQMRGIPVGAEVPDEITQVFRTEVYNEIRQEIMKGKPEDWLSEKSEDPILMPDEEDILPGILFDIKRRKDRIIKEFGW